MTEVVTAAVTLDVIRKFIEWQCLLIKVHTVLTCFYPGTAMMDVFCFGVIGTAILSAIQVHIVVINLY